MKYKIKFKADDFALSNNLTKAEDASWAEILQLREKIDKFLTPQGWLLEEDTDVHLVYVTHKPKVNEKFWGFEINLEEKWITMTKILKEEDAYYNLLYYGYIEQPELLKFFDGLDFEIFEKAAEETDQDITDWFGDTHE